MALIAPWIRQLTGARSTLTRYRICNTCGLGWSSIKYTERELENLYSHYRKQKYFQIRNSWEPSYTEALNEALDGNLDFQRTRREFLTSLVGRVDPGFISRAKVVLDIGGGHGRVIPDWHSLTKKYVLEVSDSETIPGIVKVKTWAELPRSESIDLVMACGILEHLNDPNYFLKELGTKTQSIGAPKSKEKALFYFEVPSGTPAPRKNWLLFSALFCAKNRLLWRRYDKIPSLRKSKLFPLRIAEHIQFFNIPSLKILLEKSGFHVLTIEEYDSMVFLPAKAGVRFDLGVAAVATFGPNTIPPN